jgi:hypothetical protein
MTELNFEDLTPEQKAYLIDDCGKPGVLDVPDFVFEIACERHDFDYYVGHTKQHRYEADRRMYSLMKAAIRLEPWYRRAWLYPIAWTYYTAVRIFSSKYFYYGPEKHTLEDLERDMAQV